MALYWRPSMRICCSIHRVFFVILILGMGIFVDCSERLGDPGKKSKAKSSSRLNGNDTTGLDSDTQTCLDVQTKEMEAKWKAANKAAKKSKRVGEMFLTRTEYDRGVNTFSPEGRLFQVEYAIEAIKLGSTAIGICTNEGCVLVSEKRITSPLLLSTSVRKIHEVESHLAVAVSGLIADAMTMVDKGRVEATNHHFVYDEPISAESLTKSLSNLALQFGDDSSHKSSMSRPFGVAVIVAGIEKGEPRMFHLDPSGTYTDCSAKAIGSASEGAMQQLEEQYHSQMTLFDAAKVSLTILKDVMEERLTKSNVEVWQVCTKPDQDTGRHVKALSEEEIAQIVASISS